MSGEETVRAAGLGRTIPGRRAPVCAFARAGGRVRRRPGARAAFPVALALFAAPVPAQAQQVATERIAQEVVADFVRNCDAASTDPQSYIASLAGVAGLHHVSSPDGKILALSFNRRFAPGMGGLIGVNIELSAIAPGRWVLTCNAIGSSGEEVADPVLEAAFLSAVDAVPGTQRVGGSMPYLPPAGELGDVGPGYSDISHFLYVVTGWSSTEPERHMYAEFGGGTYDLWYQGTVGAGN